MRPASPPCFFLNSFQYCTFFKLSQHDIGVLKPNIRLVLRPLKYFKIFSKKSKISMFFCTSHQNYLKGSIFLFSSFKVIPKRYGCYYGR